MTQKSMPMDDLNFRRLAYADPFRRDAEFLQALETSSSRQQFVHELQQMDNQLAQALKVAPPENMAEKLLLNTELQTHQYQQQSTRQLWNIAASFVLISIISLGMWQFGPVALGAHAIAHVQHEPELLMVNEQVPYTQVNQYLRTLPQLKTRGFSQQPANISASRYCDFQGVESLHLVLQGLQNKVSLFIVPASKRFALQQTFQEQHWQGLSFEKDGAYLVLVGEKLTDLEHIKSQLKQSFI